jgi:uncharacterized protein
MKFTLDARSDVNLIRGYGAGVVRVGDKSVHTHCIVSADTLIESWDATSPGELTPEELAPVWTLKPEVVLLGTGAQQRFPSSAVREAFRARGIGLETMDLGAACRTYNILVQEERRVVALLFLS